MTLDQLIALIYTTLPGPDQITQMQRNSEELAVRFSWKHTNYRISIDLFTETARDSCLHRDNEAILMQALLESKRRAS